MLKKIVIIGPESTGKSTLSEQLAMHYHTRWCPEYAREYLLAHGNKYTYDDLLQIAKGQLALEDQYSKMAAANNETLLFIDTDMYVMKVWCEFVFGRCHRFILDQVVASNYDAYLLCQTDLPWVPDALREHPDPPARRKLYLMYKDCMINQPLPWFEISGNEKERLQQAITAIDSLPL